MKRRPIASLLLFVALALAFSSQDGCKGTQEPSNGNGNTNTNANANASANQNANSDTVTASAYPPLASGLADAEMELLDGGKFKISDKKGKVLLLTIWGTWCGPCRAEMPMLVALQDQYRDKGLEIIGLNIGDGNGLPETNDEINKLAEQMKLNYTIARSSNANTREFYKVTREDVVPQGLLVDREGRLRGMFIGGGPRVAASITDTVAKVMAE